MASDNIFQQYLKPPKSVMEYSADMDEADSRAQTRQVNALAIAAGMQKQTDATREREADNALSRLVARGDSPDQITTGLAQQGYGRQAMAFSKAQQDQAKVKAATAKDDADTAKTNATRDIALHDFHAQRLAQVQTPEDAIAWAQQGQALGLFKEAGQFDRGLQMIQQAAQSPETFAKWKAQAMQSGQSVTEQLKQQFEATKQAEQVRQFGVTDQRIQSEGAANRGVTMRGQNLADARAREANNGVEAAFTPDAITNAAARYNTDGTLPPMGMGKAGSAGRAAILNKAAELASGIDPTQQRQNQITNKGDMATQNAAVRAFATGKDGQAIQSANTALNHLQTIRTLAEAQKSGDVRAFNQAARALGTQFGQTAPTNLNAALIMVSPEVSKAVVGVNGTGHEREQAKEALNPNGSPDQIIGSTHTLEELFAGRLTESRRTYERTTKRKDFDDALLSPAARNVIARQHAATPGAAASSPAGKPSLSDIFGK